MKCFILYCSFCFLVGCTEKMQLRYETEGAIVKIYPGNGVAGKDGSQLSAEYATNSANMRIWIIAKQDGKVDYINDIQPVVRRLSGIVGDGEVVFYGFDERTNNCKLRDVDFISIIPDFENPRDEKRVSFYFGKQFIGFSEEGLVKLQFRVGGIKSGYLCKAVGPHDLSGSYGPPGSEYPFKERLSEMFRDAEKSGVKVVYLGW